jgi:hypothetical protein
MGLRLIAFILMSGAAVVMSRENQRRAPLVAWILLNTNLKESPQYAKSLLELFPIACGKQVLQFAQQNIIVNFLGFVLEKCSRRNFQRRSHAFHHFNLWPLLASFKFAQIIWIYASPFRRHFSREVFSLSQCPNSAAEQNLSFHAMLKLQAISAGLHKPLAYNLLDITSY